MDGCPGLLLFRRGRQGLSRIQFAHGLAVSNPLAEAPWLSPAVLQELEQKQRGVFCTGQCMQISITCYLYGKYIDYHSQQRAGCLERVL